MSDNPKHIPTEAQQRLDAEVERRRKRLEDEGHATALEIMDSARLGPSEPIPSLATLLPPVMEVFDRLAEKSKAFFAELRPQFDAEAKPVPCEIHGTDRLPNFERTGQATRAQGVFTIQHDPCAACVAEADAAKARRFWTRRGLPERVLEATFGNFTTAKPDRSDEARADKALASVRAWSKRKTGFLLLVGSPGTGKGHLAAACLRATGDGLWIEHVAMLGDLRASYTLHTTKALLERWQEAEMLVLDEFGLSPGGKDEEPMLYQVLADRYDKRRPTIITSNLDRPALRDAIGYRLLDRVREDVLEVSMLWPSYRTSK